MLAHAANEVYKFLVPTRNPPLLSQVLQFQQANDLRDKEVILFALGYQGDNEQGIDAIVIVVDKERAISVGGPSFPLGQELPHPIKIDGRQAHLEEAAASISHDLDQANFLTDVPRSLDMVNYRL